MGLYDVRCALSGMSTIGQTLCLVWVHRGQPVGPVPRGYSDRGGAIDGMIVRTHYADQQAEMKTWMAAGRWDASQALPMALIRRHRPYAPALEAISSAIAAWQVGGGGPHLLDDEPVDMLPVIAEIADAAAAYGGSGPEPLTVSRDPHETSIARGVLSIFRALGGSFPFQPEIDQLHIEDHDVFEKQRREAREHLARWPELAEAVDAIRYG